jgi:flagellar basal-body rod protein FlgC
MSVDSIMAATRFGLEFERMRLEAASHNIAIANTPAATGQAAQLMHVVAPQGASFATSIGAMDTVGGPTVVNAAATSREVHDPSDPAADKNGMVAYPQVDMVQEMSTLIEAERAYEANVRAFNTLRSMELRALDIGSGA